MRHFTTDEIKLIKEAFSNNIPIKSISKNILHTDYRILKRECKNLQIEIPKYNHFNLCINPFTDLNNRDTMYWLGFLAADGYINENTLKLGVAEKDFDILDKFRLFLGGKAKIHHIIHHGKYPQIYIQSRSKEIVETLHQLGYNNQKTYTFNPNFDITWDYIRGFFDGDGYIRKKEISIISASYLHIKRVMKFLLDNNINLSLYHRINKNTKVTYYILSIHGKLNINNVIHSMYNNASTFLQRKFETAMSISDNRANTSQNRGTSVENPELS